MVQSAGPSNTAPWCWACAPDTSSSVGSFPDSAGTAHPGLELLDVTTVKGSGSRAVGEMVASPDPDGPRLPAGRPLPDAHRVREPQRGDRGGSGVVAGRSGGARGGQRRRHRRHRGSLAGRVLGTYLHGPVLARNTALADLLLGWALGAAIPPYCNLSTTPRSRPSAPNGWRRSTTRRRTDILQRTARRIRAAVGGA